MFFNPKVASSYGLHIIGFSQEKQTELFLDKLWFFAHKNQSVSFIDITVYRDFSITIATYPNTKVIGFNLKKLLKQLKKHLN